MDLRLLDDYIELRHIPDPKPAIHLLDDTVVTKGSTIAAEVLAVGPGELRPDGQRQPMPVRRGDVVRVMKGAGFRDMIDGQERWFVYGMRKDIVAVVER